MLNSEHEILHTFGNTSRFVRLPQGPPSLNVMEMLGDELRLAVGAALHRAARGKRTVTLNNVQFDPDDEAALVNVSVTPLSATQRWGTHFLVRFELTSRPEEPASRADDMGLQEAARDHIASLETELRFTKENLQATIEELETSNEELQATNEELYTVNGEYQRKIEELTVLTHDMDNLLESTDVHTIFLDDDLRIRKFTPKMADVFHLIDSDIGRAIHGFMHNIDCSGLAKKLSDVVTHRRLYEEEVKNSDGETFLMRMLPHRIDRRTAGDAGRQRPASPAHRVAKGILRGPLRHSANGRRALCLGTAPQRPTHSPGCPRPAHLHAPGPAGDRLDHGRFPAPGVGGVAP